jgi:hypothetical protein
MLRSQKVMKKKFPKNKINIKRETREKIIGNPSRKISTQEKTVPHLMKMMKATSDSKKVLFMARENHKRTSNSSKEEGEVDLKVELISALEELRKERKKLHSRQN